MEVKHTPGPWRVSDTINRRINIRNAGNQLGESAICMLPEGRIERERGANARLIAAAPELLAALEWAMSQIDDDLDLDHQNAVSAARAAIAKAKGERIHTARAGSTDTV
jgi:hypothetical protein